MTEKPRVPPAEARYRMYPGKPSWFPIAFMTFDSPRTVRLLWRKEIR